MKERSKCWRTICISLESVLELLSFKVGPGNHQRETSLLQKLSEIFGNMRLVSPKMTSHLTSHNFQILKIEILAKLCKGLVIINTRDQGGRKYNFFSTKLITHPNFPSNFHTPSENLPKLSYPNMYKLFMC